jgi:hypothetical protein
MDGSYDECYSLFFLYFTLAKLKFGKAKFMPIKLLLFPEVKRGI